MGLRDVVQKATQAAVAAVGDIAASATYCSFASASYNASAGTNVATFTSTAGVSVVFNDFRLDQVDGQVVLSEDKQAMIPALALPGVVPTTADKLVSDGATWNVQRVQTDPADALWILQVRRP